MMSVLIAECISRKGLGGGEREVGEWLDHEHLVAVVSRAGYLAPERLKPLRARRKDERCVVAPYQFPEQRRQILALVCVVNGDDQRGTGQVRGGLGRDRDIVKREQHASKHQPIDQSPQQTRLAGPAAARHDDDTARRHRFVELLECFITAGERPVVPE